jgi:hypothetical protein
VLAEVYEFVVVYESDDPDEVDQLPFVVKLVESALHRWERTAEQLERSESQS